MTPSASPETPPSPRTAPAGDRHWLRPEVLSGGGVGALLGGIGVGVVIGWPGGPVFTTGWTTTVFGLLALGAALLSAAAGRDSAATGREAAVASAASAATARRAYGQQLYELARATHTDLTTGEVALARDLLGAIGRRRRAFWPPEGTGYDLGPLSNALSSSAHPDPRIQLEEARRAWFTLLWCFQRVFAARELLLQAPDDATYGTETPVEFLDRLLRDQVRFLNDELGHARSALEEFFVERIDDRESAAALRALVPLVLGDHTELGRWALPLSTHAGEALRRLLLDEASDLALEDVATSQYQALHCLLYAGGDPDKYHGEREILPRRLHARSHELRSRGGPERSGVGDAPQSPGDLDGWARTYADPASPPVPRTWAQP